jgi:hypothetical protein
MARPKLDPSTLQTSSPPATRRLPLPPSSASLKLRSRNAQKSLRLDTSKVVALERAAEPI